MSVFQPTLAIESLEGSAIAPRAVATAADRADARGSAIAFAGTCALALAAPFELLRPIARLPWQSISSLEAVLLLVFGAWAVTLTPAAIARAWRTPLTGPWAVWVAASAISATAAAIPVNALHMVARLAMAGAILGLAAAGITTRARLRAAMSAAVFSGAVVSLLIVLEYLRVPAVLRWLAAFRPGVAVVGGAVRASGPLQYPTIASMYLETAFGLALGLMVAWSDDDEPTWAVGMLAVAALIAEAIVLTFTRAGLVSMTAGIVLVAWTRWRRHGPDAAVAMAAGLALVIACQVAASHSLDTMRLRLTTEGQDAWYRADVEAPTTLAIRTGATTAVHVTVTNTGRATWDPNGDPPVRFSYHWLLADADRVVSFEEFRTALPSAVEPGASASLDARVRAPLAPGRYRLVWDLEQQGRLWFSTEPGATTTSSLATVSGPVLAAIDRDRLPPMPRAASRPGRFVLWRAAARMVAAHPLLGVGPDNFRLLYGAYAGLPVADPRMHSNSMYVEALAGGGLLGLVAFGWLLWRAVSVFAGAVLTRTRRDRGPAVGIAAAGLAIALHGFVDSFLSFTPTYVAIALTCGLAVASRRGAESAPNANRV